MLVDALKKVLYVVIALVSRDPVVWVFVVQTMTAVLLVRLAATIFV